VTVDGRDYEIYDTADAAEMWALARTRAFRLLDDVLERGRRARARVLRPRGRAMAADAGAARGEVLDQRERPYAPTEDAPDYGRPPT
jgi:hypothetical protein